MNLEQAVMTLDALNQDSILCVRRPWDARSECVVAMPDENFGVPADVKEAGFSYFLEVFVASEVLEVLEGKPSTNDERVRLLIYYAENDAYPEWVHQRS